MTRQNVGERPRDREEANLQPPNEWSAGALVRVLYALIAGAAVGTTAFQCAWLQLRDATQFRAAFHEEHVMGQFKRSIDQYQEEHGELPTDLATALPDEGEFRVVGPDRATDYAGRVYLYHRTESGYELVSLGADGQPGGIGLDADLYDDSRYSASPRMTLHQFSTVTATRSVRVSCAIAGVVVVLLCLKFNFVDLRRVHPAPHGYLLGEIVVTTAMAAVAAFFMSAIHIPSGH